MYISKVKEILSYSYNYKLHLKLIVSITVIVQVTVEVDIIHCPHYKIGYSYTCKCHWEQTTSTRKLTKVLYMLMYISWNRFFFFKLIKKKYKNFLRKAPLFSYYQYYFQPLCPPISPRKKKRFFKKFSTQCRRGSRRGEMGEFSLLPHPPPPSFFWSPFFLFFLITSTGLWFYYIITKIRPPPLQTPGSALVCH